MTVNTEVEIAKMSFADLYSVMNFCEHSQNSLFKEDYESLQRIVINEMQYRLHDIFIKDPEIFPSQLNKTLVP